MLFYHSALSTVPYHMLFSFFPNLWFKNLWHLFFSSFLVHWKASVRITVICYFERQLLSYYAARLLCPATKALNLVARGASRIWVGFLAKLEAMTTTFWCHDCRNSKEHQKIYLRMYFINSSNNAFVFTLINITY